MKKDILLEMKYILENASTLNYIKAVEVSMLQKAVSLIRTDKTPFILINASTDSQFESDVENILKNDIEVILTITQFDRDPSVAYVGNINKKGILDIVEDVVNVLLLNKQLNGKVEMMYPEIVSNYLETTTDKFDESYASFFIRVKYRVLTDDDFYQNT